MSDITAIDQAYSKYFSLIKNLNRWLPDTLACRVASKISEQKTPRLSEKEIVLSQIKKTNLSIDHEEFWKRYIEHTHIHTLNTYRYRHLHPETYRQHINTSGENELQSAYLEGNGVLLLASHQQHLVLLAASVGLLGYSVNPLLYDPTATTTPYLQEHISTMLRDSEKKFHGGHYLIVDFKNTFIRPIYRCLDQGQIIFSTNDIPNRLAPKRRITKPFLGKNISLPTGSIEIALKRATPIFSSFIDWKGSNHFHIHFTRLNGNTSESIIIQYVEQLESMVRANPASWEAWKWPDLFAEDHSPT